ncbi:MAG: heavy-metal-associated domain-containing protein [Proteobacteria bacterium]|nr:heavy-metal-associated domain-containing protein [Pseudomonadota bacterium]
MNKRVWIFAVAMVAVGLAVGLALRSGAASSPTSPAGDQAPAERLLLGVEGVTCGSCEGRIREALEARPGVRAVAVDLALKTVTVEYVAGSDDPKALADAITRIGYPARFLASAQGLAPVQPTAARSGGGCGGSCCTGG